MPEGQVLEFTNVTKRFNEVTAVSDFSARVEPGAVTAFLGPNGAGKTTTLRILLGQVRATSGTATIGGVAYPELRQPLRTIGSVLEETAYRPRRTASRQLTIAAKANGIRLARVDEVISLVGLEGQADSRIGGFSLGMRQRLSVAHALLGDPGALVFDEPANGLDPEGIRWMRLLMRRLADEGRTVLVSSHVLSEIEQVADHVLVLSKGRLVLSSGIETLADPSGGSVVVDSVDRPGLTTALVAAGFDIEVLRSGLTVRGADASKVGAVAADAGIALSTLVQRGPTLEDVFIDLMRGGRFDTAPALEEAEGVSTETDTMTDDAAAGAAVSVLAAGGAAAFADDLSAETAGDAAAGEARSDAETAAEDSATEDDATRVVPVIDDTVAPASPDAQGSASVEADAQGDPDTDAAQSFDDILSGASMPATESPRRSFAALFAASSADAPAPEASASPEQPAIDDGDAAAATDSADGEDTEPAGVEFFSEIDAPAEDTAGPVAEPAETTDRTADDEDPRSAAVSSMLAAAARAYYEDEPRDYPLSSAESQTPAEESAAWSVASTGVIDTVPLGSDASPGTDGSSDPIDAASAEDVAERKTDDEQSADEPHEHREDTQHD